MLVSLTTVGINDKPIIVGIEINDNDFIVVTRRPKLSTMKNHEGQSNCLHIIKDTVKISLFEAPYVSYKFYRDKDYLGIFVPDHFVWTDNPKYEVFSMLKQLQPKMTRQLG